MTFKNLHIRLFCILTFGWGMGSCDTKPKPVPAGVEPVVKSLVTAVHYGTDPEAEKWYVYNDKGEIHQYNSIIDTVTFHYYRDSITKIYGPSAGQWQTSVTYYLDKKGRADSSAIRGENNELISAYRFYYDTSGYLVKTVQDVFTSGNRYRQDMRYTDGNLTEIVQFTFDEKPYARFLYTYYPGKTNPLNINLHHVLEDFLSENRLGKGNVSLVKSLVNVTMEGDTLSYLRFSYPKPESTGTFVQFEEDVLNENSTTRTYRFSDYIIE